ncbi:MAG TPA: TolC family protein [Burkholderiaceae bacterium]|jgi:cobalt-zinc-cadmium efflux system outer membrane protein|nr:TolC family protein [Burkholderiaceae bacterium]
MNVSALLCSAATLASALVCGAAHAQSVGARLGLEQSLEAARRNVEVRWQEQARSAAQADVLVADRAPFPVLTGKLSQMDLQHRLGSGPLWKKPFDRSIGVDWTYERGNKRELRTEAARRAVAAAEADVSTLVLQQQVATSAAFYDLLAAQERVLGVRELSEQADHLARTSRRRLQAGDVSDQDNRRVEVESERARADVLSAELDRRRASVGLAQLTGLSPRPEDAEFWSAEASWPAAAPASAVPPGAAADWIERYPSVEAARARLAAAESLLDGAQALRKVDPVVGASLDRLPGTSNALLELRVSIPLQTGRGYDGEVARAGALLEQARLALDRERIAARSDLQLRENELAAATARWRTYDQDILPRARKVAEQAEFAYAKGALPLVDLLDARRTLRAALLEALAARADDAKARGAWRLMTQTLAKAAGTPP